MNDEDKLDKILEILCKIQIDIAVQKQNIETHNSYFKYIAGSISGLAIGIIIAIIK